MFEKPLKFKGLTVNLVLGHFQQCSRLQILFFFLELILMGSSYILWNKFQDYQLRLILRSFDSIPWPLSKRSSRVYFANEYVHLYQLQHESELRLLKIVLSLPEVWFDIFRAYQNLLGSIATGIYVIST